MNAEEIVIEVEGHRIAGRAWGPSSGAPVLALHGWLDNAATYDRLAPALPELRLLAIDLPGHGWSDHHPAGVNYLFIDYVATVHKLLEVLGWSRCTIVGHSLGAGIAAVLAGTFADRVERLVLVEGLGPAVESDEGSPSRLQQALVAEARAVGREPPVYPDREVVLERLQAVSRMQPSSARLLLERALVDVPGGVTWRSDARLRMPSRQRFTEGQVLAFLRRITCPTLLVLGRSGMKFPGHAAQARKDAVADLRIVELDGGHHLHLDRADEVAAPIREFLGLS